MLLLLTGLLALGPVFSEAQTAPVNDSVASMSLEKKVGQLFLIGFQQRGLDARLKKFIRQYRPGGFILFRRNLTSTDQIRSFTKDLRAYTLAETGFDPFLAVDQEGGPVTRVPFFPSLPSAQAIGLGGNEALARDFGEESGRLLHWAGFNMNLAPVLDLSNPLKTSFLGPRSFGDDPELTSRLGVAYAEGLKKAGVLPTGKHFPGLGGLMADLHKTTVSRMLSIDVFRRNDLKPFYDFSRMGAVSALMISQMSYPFLDPSGRSASFSPKILKDLLRGEIGFQGLIITDDLQMKGSSLIYSAEEAAFQSLKAGADLIMISWSAQQQQRAFDRVLRALRTGEWSIDELNDRVHRILAVKAGLRAVSNPLPTRIGQGPDGTPGTRRLEQLDLRLLDNKIRRFGQRARRPATLANGVSCVVSSDQRFLASFQQGKPQGNRLFTLRKSTTSQELENHLGQDCGLIVFAVSGTKTGRVLAGLSKKLRDKTYAVNLAMPTALPATLSLAGRLEIGHPHLHAGYRVAQLLQEK
ncbi:MAG: glycoside hydrolase family 3 protein [Bdellovibrionaceae bacterium]|nr:glycoside hydrolase family 3 protein [Pseudobdellovibrionaceae bacterium]MBX3033636.1 glycoside hydrolase family 3 protein [Pseudobdellovibrionaceae bacterium]